MEASSQDLIGLVSLERINQFRFYEPFSQQHAIRGNVYSLNGGSIDQDFLPSDQFAIEEAHCFPALILQNGCIWDDGNQYLLSKFESPCPPSYRTLEDTAYELCKFINWCYSENVDYKNVKSRRLSLPTYKYQRFLSDEIDTGRIRSRTAIRYMQSIQKFYTWLQAEGRVEQRELWFEENNTSVSFAVFGTHFLRKSITSTNLCKALSRRRQTVNTKDYIVDGGQLYPIGGKDQERLFATLKQLGNTEMYLAFLIAVTTGARLSAVLTLREYNFTDKLSDKAAFIPVAIGNGTLVKNKDDKQMTISIPASIYNSIRCYLISSRRSKRKIKSKHEYLKDVDEYLFLTKGGHAYYIHEKDPNLDLYTTPPRGGAISKFINGTLRYALKKKDWDFKFRFHDLRATFGMNILEWELRRRDLNGESLTGPDHHQVLTFIRERMGHENLSTTEGYLKLKPSAKARLQIQNSFEEHLERIVDNLT